MKKVLILIVMILCSIIVISCNETSSGIKTQEAAPEKLIIYAAGDLMMTNYGEEFFSTRYNVGEFSSMAEKWGPEAYIFYDAIEKFQKETGIAIELYYFMQTKDLLTALEENINNEKCPDIIVGSYTTDEYCLYTYIKDGYFADIKPYFDQDELYTNGKYLTNVLKGGLIGDKQYFISDSFTTQ